MSEERTVPAYYPDFADAEKWRHWDGSQEARMWADLSRIRDRVIVETASSVVRAVGEGVDVGGLMVVLWSLTADEIAGVLQANMEEIAPKAE